MATANWALGEPWGVRPVIFDLEGTLVDFQWDLDAAERQAVEVLTELGFPAADLEGLDYARLLNAAVTEADAHGLDPAAVRARLDELYDEFDAEALTRWTLRDGAEAVVPAVPRRALVTNVGRAATTALLDRHGLTFDVVVTRDDVRLVKPDPAGLERAAESLGGDPLFVGDSLTDVRAGAAAGLEVAVVLGGESADEAIRAADPAHLLDRLADLLDIL